MAADGRTVVMVLHDLASAARYADTVIAVKDGRVLAQGPPRDIVDEALVKELHRVDADILHALSDGAPVVIPRSRAPQPT